MSGKPINEGRPHTAPTHPSLRSYRHYGCRCDDCRRANREFQNDRDRARRRRLADEFDNLTHGTTGTYTNWGCRCIPCAEAMSRANDRNHALNKARKAVAR